MSNLSWSSKDLGEKPDFFDELITRLKRILEYCLCCITCGCYPGPNGRVNGELYEAELLEGEREAVQNLLKYLDSPDSKEPTINDERLRALCILTYSDNLELQRSAALCFAELSERMHTGISVIILEPLVVLLRSRDVQIQKAATLAVSNFALNGPEGNKISIVNSGAIRPLIQLLFSRNLEVQCNTCGCFTTLATNDKNKQLIVSGGGVKPLLTLAKSKDVRVQRNATGALLNLTHLQANRNELVQRGALPILVEVLHSSDEDVQYYCAAALSNIAVNEKHRAMMVALGNFDVLKRLIRLLGASTEKVRCQACLALRNLASDGDNQVLIVKLEGLHLLHETIINSEDETLVAALACLRNLSIHKRNEASIISENFLPDLSCIVRDGSNQEAQIHAAGTIRNLAAGEQIQHITSNGCLGALADLTLNRDTALPVLVEVTAALAVLADDDTNKRKLLSYANGDLMKRLVSLAADPSNSEIQYNCAGTIGQMCLMEIPAKILEENTEGYLLYLENFLSCQDPSLVHIGLWTMLQLFRFDSFKDAFIQKDILQSVDTVIESGHSEAIKELAEKVKTKASS